MRDLELLNGVHVMDSRKIAEATGKRHDNVVKDIETQLGKLDGGVLRFQDTYRNAQNGQEYRCFKLPRRECLILVSGYDVNLRAAIIDRWEELETASHSMFGQVKAPKELSGALVDSMRRVYGQKEAGVRIDFLIGYIENRPQVLRLRALDEARTAHNNPEYRRASSEQIKQLEHMVADLGNKAARGAAAAAHSVVKAGLSRISQRLKNGEFDFGVTA